MARWWTVISLAALALLLLLLRSSAVPSTSWMYGLGFWGFYPQTRYRSFDLTSPILHFPKWDPLCDDGGLYLLSPRGTIVSDPGPLIVDTRGNLVWKSVGYGEITDFRAQQYNGSSYLTFWAGQSASSHRYGSGLYYMLDGAYEIYKTFQPVGASLKGDLHEFTITDSNTALMTVYTPVPGDLSSVGGPTRGWLLDSIFQEVDIETGRLIFEWRASDHVPVEHTMRTFQGPDTATRPEDGFDYFHINSVDKDLDGNYIISGRHSHQILCISAESGAILWILGGKHNMFHDLSEGRATDFWWQHHVRFHPRNTISLLDNSKSETGDDAYYGQYSRGLLLQLDAQAMTVEAIQEYADPSHHTLTQSQGSMQMLDDGRVLLDYGFLPTFSEFSADGQLLCEMRIAPWFVYRFGMVTSYRTQKSSIWAGRPSEPPKVLLNPSDQKVFVSWNGATGIESWILQGADWDGARRDIWTDYGRQRKDSFEVAFDVTDDMPDYLRLMALAADGTALGHSEIIKRMEGNAPPSSISYRVMIILGPIIGVIALVGFLCRRTLKILWRRRSNYELLRTEMHSLD